jgi:hypothetical protein
MNILFTFLLLLLSMSFFAQSYLSIPESNAVWIQGSFLYSAYNNHEHATITQVLSFGNDSLISGTNYHSLHGHAIADWADNWGNSQTYQSGTDLSSDQLRVLFRQDIPNKRIYQWDNNTNQEQLLYDFDNLTVGQPYPQTLNNLNYPQILVMAYDSVMLLDGLYHERWVLGSNSNDSGFVSVIEGVGSTMGFDLPIMLPFEQSSATLCLSVAGNPLFDGWANVNSLIPPRFSADCAADLNAKEIEKNRLDISITPNPASDLILITGSEPIEKLIVYNAIGKIIFEKTFNLIMNVTLDFSEFAPGNYFLKASTAMQQSITKQISH